MRLGVECIRRLTPIREGRGESVPQLEILSVGSVAESSSLVYIYLPCAVS